MFHLNNEFQSSVVKPKPKKSLWSIKKDGDSPVNQSDLEVITRSRHKARENVHARATIGFGFTSDWLKKWHECFDPITELSNAKPKPFANYFRHSIENRSIHFKLPKIIILRRPRRTLFKCRLYFEESGKP